MNVGDLRVADDSDFDRLKVYLTRGDGWNLEYTSGPTKVHSRLGDKSSFRMIKLHTTFKDVSADTLYDVLQDPDYRKIWDKHMVEMKDLGILNPNNDVSYYALHCPSPVKNRDFVLQRSWLQTPKEYYIINHSVFHKNLPPRKGFVRGLSYLTGFLITPLPVGCDLGYVAHSDPRGCLPVWVTNKISTIIAPRLVKKLHKACINYNQWKYMNKPQWKPWLYPEQMPSQRITVADFVRPTNDSIEDNSPIEDESTLVESDIVDKDIVSLEEI